MIFAGDQVFIFLFQLSFQLVFSTRLVVLQRPPRTDRAHAVTNGLRSGLDTDHRRRRRCPRHRAQEGRFDNHRPQPSDVVESREEDFLSQELQGGCDRDGNECSDNPEQRAADQDGHYSDQRRHLDCPADDLGHQEVLGLLNVVRRLVYQLTSLLDEWGNRGTHEGAQ